jgi:hypothetical protein
MDTQGAPVDGQRAIRRKCAPRHFLFLTFPKDPFMHQARHLSTLFLGLFMLFAFLPSHAQEMVSVNRSEVNMRAGASTRHEALWTLERGYPL